MAADHYLTSAYYVHWLHAIEELCIQDGFFTRQQLVERQTAVINGTLPEPPTEVDPTVLQKLRETFKAIAHVGLGAKRPDQPQTFKTGDIIKARLMVTSGHTRSPHFVWGKTGRVVCYAGTYPKPETSAARAGENPEPTYTVTFDGKELWGDAAEPNSSLTLDLFASYMDLVPDVAQAA